MFVQSSYEYSCRREDGRGVYVEARVKRPKGLLKPVGSQSSILSKPEHVSDVHNNVGCSDLEICQITKSLVGVCGKRKILHRRSHADTKVGEKALPGLKQAPT